MSGNVILMLAAFGVASGLVFLIAILLGKRPDSTDTHRSRLSSLSDPTTGSYISEITGESFDTSRTPLSMIGKMIMPKDLSRRGRLRQRLLQAGLYRHHSTGVFLGIKFILMVVPIAAGLVLSSFDYITLNNGIMYGALIGLLGNVAPGLWLSRIKEKRQRSVRRALPDALDVIVICLEGGLSLPGAFARVANELRTAHPLLADEMAIVRREIQLGRSTGDALRRFADRFDIEELRSMASVIIQAERFGASVVKALRVHADSLRIRRHQMAEARAQKAPLKLIFPTVLCIFPALYVVLMGPAGIILYRAFADF